MLGGQLKDPNSAEESEQVGYCSNTHLLLQLVHSLGDLFVAFLCILGGHGLLQALLELLVQLLKHRHRQLQPPLISNGKQLCQAVAQTFNEKI